MPRNLISLIDGTQVSASNTGGYSSYSNVFELACLLQLKDKTTDGSPQIVFYTSGISSQPDDSSIYNLVTGNSIRSQIVDQYTNICSNFDFASARAGNPDRIYLFGFSRGAMAIRAIAGIIGEFGLLHPRDIRHLPVLLDAWNRGQGLQGMPPHIRLLGAEVEFIGLFDSVMGGIESLSLFNPIRFSSLQMPGKCKHGVQLLAIDDNRFLFRPKRWEGSQPPRSAKGKALKRDPWMRQIWMPGVHSDIGGTGNRTWGEAALLAMTFYIDHLTCIALDQEWIGEKEESLRTSVDQSKFEISPYKKIFLRSPRHASKTKDWAERRHPICDRVDRVRYGSEEQFAWREQVIARHFESIEVDSDLAAYFHRVLDVHET